MNDKEEIFEDFCIEYNFPDNVWIVTKQRLADVSHIYTLH